MIKLNLATCIKVLQQGRTHRVAAFSRYAATLIEK